MTLPATSMPAERTVPPFGDSNEWGQMLQRTGSSYNPAAPVNGNAIEDRGVRISLPWLSLSSADAKILGTGGTFLALYGKREKPGLIHELTDLNYVNIHSA